MATCDQPVFIRSVLARAQAYHRSLLDDFNESAIYLSHGGSGNSESPGGKREFLQEANANVKRASRAQTLVFRTSEPEESR